MDTILNVVLAVSAVAGVSIAYLEYRGKNAERARANAERDRADKAERELREEEEKLRELAAHHRGRANADEREARNVDKAREAIDSGAVEHCPTCRREFESGEQVEISDTLKRQAAAIRRRASRETEEAEKLAVSAERTAGNLRKLTSP
jgi:hypothetical protein